MLLVCVMGQVAQAQAQPQLQQPQVAGLVVTSVSQDVPADTTAGPLYASFQAYWRSKFPQTLNNYLVYGKWFVTLSLEQAQTPKTGQVIEVLIVQSFEGGVVSKLSEISLQGEVNITQEADKTMQLILNYINAMARPKGTVPPAASSHKA